MAEWNWLLLGEGGVLHHAAWWTPDHEEVQGRGVTECGRKGWLHIPGLFTRMGADRCQPCCDQLGFPRGVGSPRNDDACRPFVERILERGGAG